MDGVGYRFPEFRIKELVERLRERAEAPHMGAKYRYRAWSAETADCMEDMLAEIKALRAKLPRED
jgi:hypothetical protein